MLRSASVLAGLMLLGLALPTTSSAATCSVRGQERTFGPTYVTRLTVAGVSCTTAKRFVRSYYRCRVENGGRDGRCRRVRGYSCSERRTNVISTQFDATATCRSGSRRVVHKYQQNT
jgi:hypothetical protein